VTKDEFLQAIRSDRIRSDVFSLDGQSNECYVIENRGARWVVYYSERGLETGVREFPTESAALEYMLEMLRTDPTTKR
jgi:hypothetical protein